MDSAASGSTAQGKRRDRASRLKSKVVQPQDSTLQKSVSYETPTKYQQALRHSMPIQHKKTQFSDIDMASPFMVTEISETPEI